MQEVQQLQQQLAAAKEQLADARTNADAALAQAKPPPVDDAAAKNAARLQDEVATLQKALAEANKRIATLEHTIECKDSNRAALQEEIKAAEGAKATVIKELQGARTACVLTV